MEIRILDKQELNCGVELAWEVFQQFEAPDYSRQGVEEFYKSIYDPEWLNMLQAFGAFEQNEMIGVIASRKQGSHIALFFVKGEYHRRGIGRRLFEKMLQESRVEVITVNSSPYAVPIYHKFGFQDVDAEQTVNGIRFTPMKLQVKNITK
jgi:GNAT superfamily N-acetyltransferase